MAINYSNGESRARTLGSAVTSLDAWLDTMRGPDGHGGPVAHWWQNCLQFTGAGLDWRYEGIIIGYLNLYRKTGEERWLAKARRAGDDLVRGQLPTGNFRNSCFELNPYTGGTPHEAACDVALLHLARVLREKGDPAWQTYAATAEHNLQAYIIGVLWDETRQVFQNTVSDASFVPNKAATIVEALLAWASLSGDDEPLERYALPTLEAILRCQVRAPGTRLDGAIDQGCIGQDGTGRFFPFYIARCIPALVRGYTLTGQGRYLEAAHSAMSFVLRERLPDGSFPQVIYRNGRTNRYPRWVAGVGDILRAMEVMRQQGMEISLDSTIEWLMKGQPPCGGFRTAKGFASQASQRTPPSLPEFRDILPVCGWADKAFRYLTSCVQGNLEPGTAEIEDAELACVFRGRVMRYREDATAIELWHEREPVYRWRKGSAWAEICLASGGIK